MILLFIPNLWGFKHTRPQVEFPDRLISQGTLEVTYKRSDTAEGLKSLTWVDYGRWLVIQTKWNAQSPDWDTVLVLGVRHGLRVVHGDTTTLTPAEVFLIRYPIWILLYSLRREEPPVPWVPWKSLKTKNILQRECPGFQTEWLGTPIRVWAFRGVPLRLEKGTSQGVESWEAIRIQESPSREIMDWIHTLQDLKESFETKEVQP